MRERPQTPAEWTELLNRRIEESGLSDTRFSREVLRRDPGTIRKWQNLEEQVPQVVQDFLAQPTLAPWP